MYEDIASEARKLIDSSGRISIGMHDRIGAPLDAIVSSGRDYAIFQNKVLIGYIKSGKLTWLEYVGEHTLRR